MIQLSSVTKAFGNQVLLERVSWQISAGERVGLCGPNGAGKTTLLRMLVGFEQPDEGRIILFGIIVALLMFIPVLIIFTLSFIFGIKDLMGFDSKFLIILSLCQYSYQQLIFLEYYKLLLVYLMN